MSSVIVLIVAFGRVKSLIAYSGYALIIDQFVEHDFHTEPFNIIKSPYFLRYALGNSTGSTIKNISLKAMRLFPIPPENIQKQFAQRIQAIEAQKQQAQASLEKSNDLFNSLLQRAFKGELTN